MKMCVLSVVNAGADFSIAGINLEGEWVRPISSGAMAPHWDETHLNFDFGYGFIRVGDIIEFEGGETAQHGATFQPEDILVPSGKMILKNRLPNKDLLWFLEAAGESKEDFEQTIQGKDRSLCVIKVDQIDHFLVPGSGNKLEPRMHLTNASYPLLNPVVQASQYPVTDSKWSHLIRNQMVQNHSDYKEVYITIGLQQLSGPTEQVEPQIIGIHTDPEVSLPNQYPYQ